MQKRQLPKLNKALFFFLSWFLFCLFTLWPQTIKEKMMNELLTLEIQLKACEQKMTSLQKEIESLKTLLIGYEQETASLKRLSESYKAETEALQKLLEDYKAQVAEQEEIYKTLTKQYSDLKATLAHLKAARSLWVGIGITGWMIAITAIIVLVN